MTPLRRGSLFLLSRILRLIVLFLPLCLLASQGFDAFLRQVDGALRHATPLAIAEASRVLDRPVSVGSIRVGKLGETLSIREIWDLYKRRESIGGLPVVITDIRLGNRPNVMRLKTGEKITEIEAAGGPQLARVGRVSLVISVPALLSGQSFLAVPVVQITDADVTVVRYSDGSLNLTQILPPKAPNQKPSPPFQTVVEVTDTAVRLRDYNASLPKAWQRPAENRLAGLKGTVDLTGVRQARFDIAAHAAPGSATARRMGGELRASGVFGRGNTGERADGPAPESARYIARLSVGDVLFPYWLNYFVQADAVQLRAGRGDVAVSLVAPRPRRADDPIPGVGLRVVGNVREGVAKFPFLPQPIEGTAGTFEFQGGLLSFDMKARFLKDPVAAEGVVWDLRAARKGAPAPQPQLAIDLSSPGVRVRQAVAALLPRGQRLPPNLSVGGVAAVRATVSGTARNLVATGHVSGLEGAYAGYPTARSIAGEFALADNVLKVSNATANLEGGGRASGRFAYQLGPKGSRGAGDFSFAGRVEEVDLRTIRPLGALAKSGNGRLRLQGLGTVDAVGQQREGRLTAAANVTTRGLVFGNIPVPVARARVLVAGGGIMLSAARIESGAGTLSVDGTVGRRGELGLQFAAASLDLAELTAPFGLQGFDGLITGSGSVSGTAENPRLVLREGLGLNLRFRTAPAPGSPELSRRFSAHSVTIRNAVLTRQTLLLPEPVVVRRFPAIATISGRIDNLLPPAGGDRSNFPLRLALNARVQRLDFDDIQDLVRPRPHPALTLAAARVRRAGARLVRDSGRPAPRVVEGVSGVVTDAYLQIRGPLNRLQITGQATAGPSLIGDYPLDGGSIRFAYDDGRVVVPSFRIAASAGTLTGSGVLGRDGTIRGNFRAPNLDVARVSYLTDKYAALGGEVSINGVISGSIKRPTVTVDVAPSTLNIAGAPLKGFSVQGLRYTGGEGGTGVLTLPSLSFQQDNSTVRLENVRYDIATRSIRAEAAVDAGDLGGLLDTLRRSGLSATPAGAAFLRSLNQLPSPISGHFSVNRLAVDGRMVGQEFQVTSAVAEIGAKDLRVGEIRADTVTARATMAGNLIRLENFVISSPGAILRAQGTYDLNGNINAVLESNEADLDILRAFAQFRGFPLRGKVDISVTAQGPRNAPTITASLLGRNILVETQPSAQKRPDVDEVLGAAPSAAAAETAVAKSAGPERRPFVLSLLRAEGQLVQEPGGEATLVVREALATRGEAEVRVAGNIPLALAGSNPGLADRPISLRATVPRLNLAAFADLLSSAEAQASTVEGKAPAPPAPSVGGTLEANIALGGTLRQPVLSGGLTITDASYTLPRGKGDRTDRFNPITDADVNLVLSGSRIDFETFKVSLGAPNGGRRAHGALTVGGSVTVDNLAELQNLLKAKPPVAADGQGVVSRRDAPAFTSTGIRGTVDLTATLDNLEPIGENLLGLGEGFRSRLNGVITAKGPLLTPLIETAPGKPIEVAGAELRLPDREPTSGEQVREAPSFNPRFNMALSIPGKAAVASRGVFRFEANGSASVRGPMYRPDVPSERGAGWGFAPDVRAELTTVGGYFQFPTARFSVQRGGIIRLRFDPGRPESGVSVTDVIARARIYVQDAAALARYAPGNRGSFGSARNQGALGTAQTPGIAPAAGYDITVTLNGPLDIFQSDTGPSGPNGGRSRSGRPEFSSNPPLEESQIIALLGSQQQIDLASQGRVEEAAQGLINQALVSGFLPRYLAPLTEGLRGSLGLESFSVSYNPDAPIQVFLQKRLPDPFDRFLVDFSRSFSTQRNQVGQQLPYLFSFSYDLYLLRPSDRIQPRIRAGFSSDEQRTVTYFLRGTITY